MVEQTEDMDKLCETLDKLTLDALLLLQEEIEMKLNIENAMCEGESHLIKSRYILGVNQVSSLQLPTENSEEFSSCFKVNGSETILGRKIFDLYEIKKSDDNNVVEPLWWFGRLSPQYLVFAQKMFRQALQWTVKAANVQNRLQDVLQGISVLKEVKHKMTLKE
ncbi:uncharacterized protein LOC130444237 [Diorhabda sublineata]|uniref:uncharacterized protein LOC130444237 n=1 Tax=Diorhabda sublineata TaxID=1163346 RepID=UPI0024E0EDCB|nr:uncharacterized protein LOC130444237 [Diorhabda sublineata]